MANPLGPSLGGKMGQTARPECRRANVNTTRILLALAIFVAMRDEVSWARSRDFSAPPEVVEPALPRSGPVFVSFGIGFDFLSGAWRETETGRRQQTASGGFDLRARFGTVVRQRVVLFLDAQARAPVVPPIFDLYLAGVGAGAMVFLSARDPWHLDLALRRSWAGVSTLCCSDEISPPVESFQIWLAELGLGYVSRAGHSDAGWTLSLLSGLIRSSGVSGWMVGSALTYAWSRS